MSGLLSVKQEMEREEVARLVGGWLREVREDKMLSPSEVANTLGCHPNAVRQLERGVDGVPSILVVRKYLKACGAWNRANWAVLGGLLIDGLDPWW